MRNLMLFRGQIDLLLEALRAQPQAVPREPVFDAAGEAAGWETQGVAAKLAILSLLCCSTALERDGVTALGFSADSIPSVPALALAMARCVSDQTRACVADLMGSADTGHRLQMERGASLAISWMCDVLERLGNGDDCADTLRLLSAQGTHRGPRVAPLRHIPVAMDEAVFAAH